MKFAHLADVHLGGWREPKLRELNTKSFVYAIDKCITEKVDFVIIAGDLFNTSLPSMDALKVCVQKLRELKDNGISVYLIPGSHDFSPSGKTMIDILEQAGIAVNVAKEEPTSSRIHLSFTTDKKTGVKITGIFGKRGGLEKHTYEKLDKEKLEAEAGTKIFLFHSAVTELMPKSLGSIDALPVSSMPKKFDYYAGGHIHIRESKFIDGYGTFVYPGPLFPNNFSELEELGCGSFTIYDNDNIRYEKIQLQPVVRISADVTGKSASEAEKEIQNKLNMTDVTNAIVLIRAEGMLREGKPGDIPFNLIIDSLNRKGAYVVLKNTNKLESKEFEEIKVSKGTVDEIEEDIINKHIGQLKIMPKEKEGFFAKELMRILSAEKEEGEKVADFEKRISHEVDKLLGL
ncbi:MAG: exonuclease SbcCD subunit D [Candidatus Woesearchaeota archaeon]